jgi:predicted aspartyl protease
MITGAVNARLEATIRLPVRDAAGQDHEIEAIVDTGFTGSLTLPPVVIAGLGLAWRSRGQAFLADRGPAARVGGCRRRIRFRSQRSGGVGSREPTRTM